MNLHRPAFARRKFNDGPEPPPLPANSPYIPPEARASAEAEAAERAVAVEPPGDPVPPPEQPLNDVRALIRDIVAEVRRQEGTNRNHLDRVAALVRTLTFGEMVELAEGLWKCRPEDAEVSAAAELPAILHKWSTSRCGNT